MSSHLLFYKNTLYTNILYTYCYYYDKTAV